MKMWARTCCAAAMLAAADALFVPVSDPRISISGRYAVNADGSFGFDWPGVAFFINVVGTTSVRSVVNSTQITRLVTSVSFPARTDGYSDFPVSSVWVGPGLSADNTYVLGAALSATTQYTLRLTHDLSSGQTQTWKTGVGFDLYGFVFDDGATVLDPAAGGLPLQRRLEFVGDSITVGAGAEGAPPGSCPYSDFLEHNSGTWDRQLCANLTANCSVIAWSGKGLFANSNGQGETMPQYFLQTLGAENYSQSWDFSRFVPDAVVIHLGTNDFNSPNRHDPNFPTDFTNAAIDFVNAIRTKYYNVSGMAASVQAVCVVTHDERHAYGSVRVSLMQL